MKRGERREKQRGELLSGGEEALKIAMLYEEVSKRGQKKAGSPSMGLTVWNVSRRENDLFCKWCSHHFITQATRPKSTLLSPASSLHCFRSPLHSAS